MGRWLVRQSSSVDMTVYLKVHGVLSAATAGNGFHPTLSIALKVTGKRGPPNSEASNQRPNLATACDSRQTRTKTSCVCTVHLTSSVLFRSRKTSQKDLRSMLGKRVAASHRKKGQRA